MKLDGKKVLITGGTGSLGKVLVKRILSGELGNPEKVVVFSRDEAKQHYMRLDYLNMKSGTDAEIYENFKKTLSFWIGDIRDYPSVSSAMKGVDIVFNAAALKQVPTCEYFPYEAVKTNIIGAENLARAIIENELNVETVIGVSTDKAVNPINVMGMTKSLMERILIVANLKTETRFSCVRYGNVLASRGSVIPYFHDQILNGGPVTITTEDMTRFFLTLNHAVDTIFAAVKGSKKGEIYIPKVPSANIVDLADALIDGRPIKKKVIGIRPGEKIHEVLISNEEIYRTVDRDNFYVIKSIIPELVDEKIKIAKLPASGYSSKDNLISTEEIHAMLKKYKLRLEDVKDSKGEVLR